MKFRPALLFCLLLSVGFPSLRLSAGYGITPASAGGSPVPSTYRGRAGKYIAVATFQTNGTISAHVYTNSNNRIIAPDELITGMGTNTTNGFLYVSFGEFGYLEGRAHRRGTKIIARLVLQTADKVIRRRCVLKRDAGQSGGHGVVVTYLPTPVSTPRPTETNPVGLTREEAEAVIELARRIQQQNNSAIPTILSPGVRNSF